MALDSLFLSDEDPLGFASNSSNTRRGRKTVDDNARVKGITTDSTKGLKPGDHLEIASTDELPEADGCIGSTETQSPQITRNQESPKKDAKLWTFEAMEKAVDAMVPPVTNQTTGGSDTIDLEAYSDQQAFVESSPVNSQIRKTASNQLVPERDAGMVKVRAGTKRGVRATTTAFCDPSGSRIPSARPRSPTGDAPTDGDDPAVRIQNSSELRDLAYQNWVGRRGQRFVREKQQQVRRQAEHEQKAKKQREEKERQNRRVYNAWMAKKREQLLAEENRRRDCEAQQQREEESKQQQRESAAKAFEMWVAIKKKQTQTGHSNRERTDEGSNDTSKKLEQAIAAREAFEAWQQQKKKLDRKKQLEAKRASQEEAAKQERANERRELARARYAQWELQKINLLHGERRNSTQSAQNRRACSDQPLMS